MNTIKKEIGKNYEIKVATNEYVNLVADNWKCGVNGLKFYLNGVLIAWFITWCHWQLGTTSYEETKKG